MLLIQVLGALQEKRLDVTDFRLYVLPKMFSKWKPVYDLGEGSECELQSLGSSRAIHEMADERRHGCANDLLSRTSKYLSSTENMQHEAIVGMGNRRLLRAMRSCDLARTQNEQDVV